MYSLRKMYTMITQYEVPGYLAQLLPASAFKPQPGHISLSLYGEVQHLTDYTKVAAEGHNYSLVKKCFLLAEKLYVNGDTAVRNSIENIFIFSFSSMIPQNRLEKVIFKSLIPATLYHLYVKQASPSGC
jgi:hypothetical protein